MSQSRVGDRGSRRDLSGRLLVKSAVDRGEHRQSLLPRDAFSSLTVASQDQAVEGQAEIPGQLGRVVVTVDSKGGGGGWSILDGVGLPTCLPAHTLLAPPPPYFPPSCFCRKAALARGSRGRAVGISDLFEVRNA